MPSPINQFPLRARAWHIMFWTAFTYVGPESRVGVACRSTTHPHHFLPVWGRSTPDELGRVAIRLECCGILVGFLAPVTAVSLMSLLKHVGLPQYGPTTTRQWWHSVGHCARLAKQLAFTFWFHPQRSCTMILPSHWCRRSSSSGRQPIGLSYPCCSLSTVTSDLLGPSHLVSNTSVQHQNTSVPLTLPVLHCGL